MKRHLMLATVNTSCHSYFTIFDSTKWNVCAWHDVTRKMLQWPHNKFGLNPKIKHHKPLTMIENDVRDSISYEMFCFAWEHVRSLAYESDVNNFQNICVKTKQNKTKQSKKDNTDNTTHNIYRFIVLSLLNLFRHRRKP